MMISNGIESLHKRRKTRSQTLIMFVYLFSTEQSSYMI
jgi:hypothetical protein